MKVFRCSTTMAARLLFFSGLVLWGVLAWRAGSAAAVVQVWVPREKIVGAQPYTVMEQVSLLRGLLAGASLFAAGTGLSYACCVLYAAALGRLRGERE